MTAAGSEDPDAPASEACDSRPSGVASLALAHPTGAEFVCLDRRLGEAAQLEGFEVKP